MIVILTTGWIVTYLPPRDRNACSAPFVKVKKRKVPGLLSPGVSHTLSDGACVVELELQERSLSLELESPQQMVVLGKLLQYQCLNHTGCHPLLSPSILTQREAGQRSACGIRVTVYVVAGPCGRVCWDRTVSSCHENLCLWYGSAFVWGKCQC